MPTRLVPTGISSTRSLGSWLTAAICLASAAVAQTSTYWVDATRGSDTNPGTFSRPFKSITKGVAFGQRDAVIRVRPGTYSPSTTGEVFTIQFTGSHQRVRLIGESAATCVIDFEQAVGSRNAFYFYVDTGAADIEIAHLTMKNGAFRPAVPWYSSAIWWNSVDGLHLHHCRIESCESGIYSANGSKDVSVHDNVFLGNNVPVRFRQDSTKGGGNCRFFNNLVLNSTGAFRDTVSLSGNDPTQICVNNIVLNNPGDGFRVTAQAGLVFENNVGFGNGTDFAYSGGTLPTSNRAIDPLLANVAGGDYRQQAASPCREAGYPIAQPRIRNDWYGNSRATDVDGDGRAVVDIGIHEVPRLNLTVTNWTQGQTAQFAATSALANSAAAILLSPAPASVTLDPYGTLGIDLTTVIPLGTGRLPLSVNLPIPVNPWFNGQYLYVQAIAFTPSFRASGTLDLGL